MLPNYIIIGAPKCGTTSVFHWLNQHPEVCGSNRKEVQFFMDRDSSVFRKNENFLDQGIDGYEQFFTAFKPKTHKAVIEATPGYVYQKTALENIPSLLPDTKFILILREPVSRLYSIFKYFSQNKGELEKELTFGEFVALVKAKDPKLKNNEFLRDAIEHGIYVNYVKEWVEKSGAERVKVLLYEDLKKDSKSFTKALAQFMEIDANFFDSFEFESQNQTVQIKNHFVHKLAALLSNLIPFGGLRDKIRELYFSINGKTPTSKKNSDVQQVFDELKAFYKPFNEQLKTMTGLDVSIWN